MSRNYETIWSKVFASSFLGTLSIIFLYSGAAALFLFWEKPKPKVVFLILALSLPLLMTQSAILNVIYESSSIATIFIVIVEIILYLSILVVWSALFLLNRRSKKSQEQILIPYMFLFSPIIIDLLLNYVDLNSLTPIISGFIVEAAMIAVSVTTIIYTSKKLRLGFAEKSITP